MKAVMAQQELHCIAPAEITADALFAYSRGDAPAGEVDHIERCPHCQGRVGEYAAIERQLIARLYRRTCPDTLTIGEYTLGILPADAMLSIAEHLVGCTHCAAESRGYTRFFAEPDTPPAHGGILTTIRRLIALPLDAPKPVLAGLRGGANEETAAYTADGITIFVSVQRESRGRGFVLAGMLQTADPLDESSAEARLFDGDHLLQTEPIDDLGSFFFGGVPAGAYRIEVQLPDAIVELTSIAVA
jgi:hypothetical protein